MNQQQFNSASNQAHDTINDLSKISHKIVDTLFSQIPPIINYANINLGNDDVVRQNNRTQPRYEIIKEDKDSSLIYMLRINVFLPGCVKENVTTSITGDTLNVHARTNLSEEGCIYKETYYETEFKLPKNSENLKIKFHSGVLKIIIKNPQVNVSSTNVNIE